MLCGNLLDNDIGKNEGSGTLYVKDVPDAHQKQHEFSEKADISFYQGRQNALLRMASSTMFKKNI